MNLTTVGASYKHGDVWQTIQVNGEEITSPTMRPMPAQAVPARDFDAWVAKLDMIVWRKVGCSLDDLEDFNTLDGYEDGFTPAQFYREYIAPEIE